MKASFYIRKDKVNKDNEMPIYLLLSYASKNVRRATGYFCKEKDWLAAKQRISSTHKLSATINARLAEIVDRVNKYVLLIETERRDAEEIEVQQLLYELGLGEAPKYASATINPTTVAGAVELYISLKAKEKGFAQGEDISKTPLRTYKQIIGHLQNFRKDTPLDKSNYTFWVDFIDYLNNDADLEQNTIAGHIRRLKTIYKYLDFAKIKVPLDILKLNVPTTDVEMVYLTIDEVEQIENSEPKQDYLQRTKDMFLFQCYTGIRHSDLVTLKPENIYTENNKGQVFYFIRFAMVKTRKICHVPLSRKALEIINKYKGLWATCFPDFSQQNYNLFIKEVAKQAGIDSYFIRVYYKNGKRCEDRFRKYELVSSHSGRHTFATTYLAKGGNVVTLSKLMGHGSIDMTMKYAKVSNQQINEEFYTIMQ